MRCMCPRSSFYPLMHEHEHEHEHHTPHVSHITHLQFRNDPQTILQMMTGTHPTYTHTGTSHDERPPYHTRDHLTSTTRLSGSERTTVSHKNPRVQVETFLNLENDDQTLQEFYIIIIVDPLPLLSLSLSLWI